MRKANGPFKANGVIVMELSAEVMDGPTHLQGSAALIDTDSGATFGKFTKVTWGPEVMTRFYALVHAMEEEVLEAVFVQSDKPDDGEKPVEAREIPQL